MNTNNLKRFAQEARRKLLEQVSAKLSFVLNADSAILREQAEQVQQLRLALDHASKEQLIEKVAYTWFNRLMALRFMDANDYQPTGIRIITPKDGYTTPEILDEAKQGNIPEELKLNRQKVHDLLDGRIPSSNPQNEAFKVLLIASCNHLNTLFPFLFEKISDYTELLLPDDLTSDFSIVTDIREGMPTEDCMNVEIIGWIYQFYISEKKDEVFASKSAVKKEDIPAATQLFTPRWIVEYMVQNTLGKLWLQNRPKSKLRDYMPYFIESESLMVEDYLKVSSPEEIKLADPASGSGHILVYSFDLFTKIYEEEGYSNIDIPKLIIEKNLFGFEIDERAAQLSGLALMMKAREYHRRALRKEIQPNIICFNDLEINDEEIKNTFISLKINVSEGLLRDLHLMQQATNYGSLILPHSDRTEIISVIDKLTHFNNSADIFRSNTIDAIAGTLSHLLKLALKFHCVAANPPYMGSGNMNVELSKFVKTNYPDSKADLMACFMESGLAMLHPKGYLGMINQHSWMFLSSYESLRIKLIKNTFIDTLLHLGARTFPEIGGEVVQNTSFTFWNNEIDKKGYYIRLVDLDNSELKREKTIEAIRNNNCGWFYKTFQNNFEKIPGNPIAFWVTDKVLIAFQTLPQLSEVAKPRQGLATSDNERFLKHWFEVVIDSIGFDFKTRIDALNSKRKWFPCQKGGTFRKWYGNNNYIINWENDGEELLAYATKLYKSPTRTIKNMPFYFREGITWSTISSSALAMRFSPYGFISETKGAVCFSDNREMLFWILGYANSKLVNHFLKATSPTLDYHEGPVARLPLIQSIEKESLPIINNCVQIALLDWDSKETSWDFLKNELLRDKGQDLDETYDLYKLYWENKFYQLHKNEEELNKLFIGIYDLKDEMAPDVPFEDITILKEETFIENKQLVFKANEVFAQFISYAVGCMFGRYSLDKEGLILANQGETLQDYLVKIEKTVTECTLLPDEDNIVPILDDEWFEDDIVGRFYEFMKVTFGEKNFNKNLSFIEAQLGKDIRKYFTKDFYSDHIQRYKKRPIYWMFSSPKGSFNVLIYIHRYNPDTLSNILNKYLREFVGKLKSRKENLQHILVNGSPAQITSAIKENDNIDRMLIELQGYERDILFPLATERIAIDLDDGVLVNYNKFGKAVKEVAGLNNAATKKKVREFVWIDSTTII